MEALPTLMDLPAADLLIAFLPILVTNGYTITGEGFRVCQNDGTWSGTAPTCQGEFHYVLMVDRLYCLHSHLS